LSFLLTILKNIVLKLATTGAFSYLQPWLLKVDKWCEEKLGIDIIKQDKKFHEKWPLVSERINKLEEYSHEPIGLCDFDGYKELLERVETLEKKHGKHKTSPQS